jgi:hypothetical protein
MLAVGLDASNVTNATSGAPADALGVPLMSAWRWGVLDSVAEVFTRFFLPGKAIQSRNSSHCLDVIPAKAGIHASHSEWIPAFAGMTVWPFEGLWLGWTVH